MVTIGVARARGSRYLRGMLFRKHAWVARLVIASTVLLGVGGIGGAVYALRGPAAARRALRPLPAPTADAYATGGQPLADPVLETLLGTDLPALVVATDHARRGELGAEARRGAALTALRATPAMAAHGDALARAWGRMLDSFAQWQGAQDQAPDDPDEAAGDGRATQTGPVPSAADLRGNCQDVTDQLAVVGLGYYVECSVRTRPIAVPLVDTYRVERVGFVTAAGARRRVLELRRLDRLNYAHAMLGMESDELGGPVLLLDQVDEYVVDHILPVLAPDAPYPWADESWQATDIGAALGRDAGHSARGELTAALAEDADDAATVGALLVRRRAIVARAKGQLTRSPLFLPEGAIEALGLGRGDRHALGEIEAGLTDADAPRAAGLCRDIVTASVRRHEAQHGFDDDRDVPLPVPAPLAALLGPGTGRPGDLIDSARTELSARLSEIANDPRTPKTSYLATASFALARPSWGHPESYAAVVITEGIARHLSAPAASPVIHDHEIHRARMATLVRAILAASPADVRAAARATYRDLFGVELTTITDA